ncbi:hypothetical protein GCM10008939_23410 [Deinococcus aquiradiocola]|uniref:Uncharacterized protein n=2 Tax=Deinococcus aquiradiocola TaxID=393059 RepID=A0A917PHB8_9DEIO|nr:hypothetical protein GCM10008939_23410 [Deinococcus aquiradiocola]
MVRLTSRGAVADRAAILHDLGWAALEGGEVTEGARLFEEGLALCRRQRAARAQLPRLLTGLSAADRVRGLYTSAAERARAAHECSEDAWAEFHAALSLATAWRLAGDAIVATRHHYVALRLAGPLGHEADVAALLDLVTPGSGRPDDHLLRPEVLHRLALIDAEGLLRNGVTPVWPAGVTPFAVLDETRRLPRVREALRLRLPDVPDLTIRVIVRGRPGLDVAGRFVPLHGDARSLALLAYLVECGPSPWPVVADAVLDEGDRSEVYAQVKYHLSRVRGLLGEPRAVTLRRGRLALSPHWTWTSDVREAGPPVRLDAPLDWLDALA